MLASKFSLLKQCSLAEQKYFINLKKRSTVGGHSPFQVAQNLKTEYLYFVLFFNSCLLDIGFDNKLTVKCDKK